MLDENLPAFYLKPSSTGVKHHAEFNLSVRGSDPEPAYHLQHVDPASPSPAHKNCYAAALFDAYNPDVLFGEVLARPEWNQPKADAQGGVPPPPQPVLPTEFAVQLYNPEQQVKVEVKSSMFGSDTYEFSMAQDVFRTPSGSALDKSLSDPASLEITPRVNFVWRKDGRLNKDLTCFMTGKSTDEKKRSKKKDPDISIALWRNMRELTMYESNLGRVDMEDPKGLEVVLLLSAVVIKDLYFSPRDHLHEVFNISDVSGHRRSSGGGRKLSSPKAPYAAAAVPNSFPQPPPPGAAPNEWMRNSLPKLQTDPSAANAPPITDPRSQWELDRETARLKAEADAERAAAERERRKRAERDEAERKRLLKMVEEEEKAQKRAEEKARKMQQAEIDKETERLRKLYGVQPIPQYQGRPSQPSGSGYSARQMHSRPYLAPQSGGIGSNGLYVGPSTSTNNVVMSGGNNGLVVPGNKQPKKKRSFFM